MDSIMEVLMRGIKAVTSRLGGFMDIHKVITVYLWPFVFVAIAGLMLLGYDRWLG